MARAKKTQALTKFDEEMAAAAAKYAEQEAGTGGGQFLSTAGGTLSFNGNPLPNNEMAVIVVDSVLENTYYTTGYSPEDPAPPVCYAFGRSEEDLRPHPEADEAQAASCLECPNNEWGSSDRGRGKACGNRRRIALLPAGVFDKAGDFEPVVDAEEYQRQPLTYLRLPTTSIVGYAQYVKQLANSLKRPPWMVFTRVFIEPDPKVQYRVLFEALDKVPDELFETLKARNEEAQSSITFPYAKQVEAPTARKPKKATRRATKKAPSKKPQRRRSSKF